MPTNRLPMLIQHLRRAARPRAPDDLTDAQLLDRFVRRRDEAAFEVLVWRHGTMVLNVCLRALRHEHDAEDAFQATFLVLARKAGAIGKAESVGSWLYKVAYRVALRAQTTVPVLSLPEGPLRDTAAADPAVSLLNRELGSVFDEEVTRLSDKYRAAFVLCYVEGQTLEAAARVLGCPPGTVGTRVARARELLRRRLSRRGYSSAPLAARQIAPLPPALVATTVKAALLGTVHDAVAAGVISAHAAGLTKGALRTMFLIKWAPTTLVALLGLSLFGVTMLAQRPRAAEVVQAKPAPIAQRPPTPEKGTGVVLAWKFVKGQPFYQEMTTELTQTVKSLGPHAILSRQKQALYLRWAPLKKDGDGWALRQKIEGVKADIDIGGSKVTFDSTRDKGPEGPLADFYRALVGSELTVTLNKDCKVRKLEGREELIEKQVAVNRGLAEVVRHTLNQPSLRVVGEAAFAGLPKGAVRPGGSWTEKRTLELSTLGTYQVIYRYTYEGKKGKFDKFAIAVEGLRKTPSPKGAGDRGQIKKDDLKLTKSTGVLLFDREKGRSAHLDLRLKVEGRVTLVSGKQIEVALIQLTTVKTTDTSPLKPPGDARDREIARLKEENARLRRRLQAVEEALRGERKPWE